MLVWAENHQIIVTVFDRWWLPVLCHSELSCYHIVFTDQWNHDRNSIVCLVITFIMLFRIMEHLVIAFIISLRIMEPYSFHWSLNGYVVRDCEDENDVCDCIVFTHHWKQSVVNACGVWFQRSGSFWGRGQLPEEGMHTGYLWCWPPSGQGQSHDM